MSYILKEQDGLRVRLAADENADEPDNDWQSPLLRLRYNRAHRWQAEHVVVGSRPTDCDTRIEEAAARWGSDLEMRSDLEMLGKYLRAYHGTKVIRQWSSDDYTYITYDTAQWREYIGFPVGSELPGSYEASVNLDEYRAWCEGDVYGYIIEREVTWVRADMPDSRDTMTTWEEVDSCWGFYGWEQAEESAAEAFNVILQETE